MIMAPSNERLGARPLFFCVCMCKVVHASFAILFFKTRNGSLLHRAVCTFFLFWLPEIDSSSRLASWVSTFTGYGISFSVVAFALPPPVVNQRVAISKLRRLLCRMREDSRPNDKMISLRPIAISLDLSAVMSNLFPSMPVTLKQTVLQLPDFLFFFVSTVCRPSPHQWAPH